MLKIASEIRSSLRTKISRVYCAPEIRYAKSIIYVRTRTFIIGFEWHGHEGLVSQFQETPASWKKEVDVFFSLFLAFLVPAR